MRASCCTTLRTATLIIGFVNTVIYLGMLGYWISLLAGDEVHKLNHDHNHLSATKGDLKGANVNHSWPFAVAPVWLCALYILYSISGVLLNVYLIFGIADDKPAHVAMWLNITAIINCGMLLATVAQITILIVNNLMKHAITWITCLFAGMILYIYTAVVVRAFFKDLTEEESDYGDQQSVSSVD